MLLPATDINAPEGQYKKERTRKTQVALHFTAGSTVEGAVNHWLSTKWGDGTALLIARNGELYQFFDPNYWAVNLFRHKKGDPKGALLYGLERSALGVEIVNPGPLELGKREDNKRWLYPWWEVDQPNRPGRYKDPWCHLDDVEMYVQETYRRRHFFATFTPHQYSTLRSILEWASEEFGISVYNAPPNERGRLDHWPAEEIRGWSGVANHGNYRRDKFDIGPAFNWKSVHLA